MANSVQPWVLEQLFASEGQLDWAQARQPVAVLGDPPLAPRVVGSGLIFDSPQAASKLPAAALAAKIPSPWWSLLSMVDLACTNRAQWARDQKRRKSAESFVSPGPARVRAHTPVVRAHPYRHGPRGRLVSHMRDTLPEALEVQTLALRRLGGVRRFRLACQMSQTLRALARARIASQHRELDEAGIRDELLRELYGFRRPT